MNGVRGREALRLAVATLLMAAWLSLLLVGHPLGAWVHLLLAAALAVTPWSLVRP